MLSLDAEGLGKGSVSLLMKGKHNPNNCYDEQACPRASAACIDRVAVKHLSYSGRPRQQLNGMLQVLATGSCTASRNILYAKRNMLKLLWWSCQVHLLFFLLVSRCMRQVQAQGCRVDSVLAGNTCGCMTTVPGLGNCASHLPASTRRLLSCQPFFQIQVTPSVALAEQIRKQEHIHLKDWLSQDTEEMDPFQLRNLKKAALIRLEDKKLSGFSLGLWLGFCLFCFEVFVWFGFQGFFGWLVLVFWGGVCVFGMGQFCNNWTGTLWLQLLKFQ